MRLAELAGAGAVLLFHHDPVRTDDEVDALAERLGRDETLHVEPAIEGVTIQL